MHGRIADMTEVRTAMPPGGSKPSPTMMPAAEMRVTKTMMAEMAAAEMTATVMPATVTTPVATAVTAAMTTAVATAALRQSPACQHASQGHRDNSKDWSQHLTLP
ncbi:hypothetical protein [Bradyrhizobium sp. NAS80.1]|uniref:hypothetical protein n=1 Tax=Bradyrhizobium sp. NAS80.1 TaxID=1680159 RepID=UPI001FDA035D|nr:hypothetical protein [Bradyrhizobium sp. NAS80.1]